jgi:hypothetical protein
MTEYLHRDPTLRDELLTIDEVGELLRMPVDSLRCWRVLGTGPLGLAQTASDEPPSLRTVTEHVVQPRRVRKALHFAHKDADRCPWCVHASTSGSRPSAAFRTHAVEVERSESHPFACSIHPRPWGPIGSCADHRIERDYRAGDISGR